MTTAGRLYEAKRRASDTKTALAVAASAAFLAVGVLAKAHHPATAATKASTASTSTSNVTSSFGNDGFDFQPGSVTQSSGTPAASTHAS
jgi:hypothetical protein